MQRLSRYKKISILAIGLCLSVLLSTGSIGVQNTDASWSSVALGHDGSFHSGAIGKVNSFTCEHKKLLGTGLLANQMKISWQSPTAITGQAFDYEIVVSDSFGQTQTFIRKDLSYTYTVGNTGNLLDLTVTLSVTPILSNSSWRGPTTTQKGLGLSVLGLGVIVTCGSTSTSP